MYEIFVKNSFSAAHRLRGYPGECARYHGHNWEVTAYLRTEEMDETGLTVDFRAFKETLGDILSEFDHRDLGDHPAFREVNPSSEVLAHVILEKPKKRLVQ